MTSTQKKSDYADIGDKTPSASGQWLEPGKYELEIHETKHIEGFKGKSFVAEFDVLASGNPKILVGTRVSWVANLKHVSALANIKGFLAKALNVPHGGIEAAHAEAVVDGSNPLKGTVLACIATHRPTKNGGIFTVCAWDYLRGGPAGEAQTPPA